MGQQEWLQETRSLVAAPPPRAPWLVICPGFQPPEDTAQMLADMDQYPAFRQRPRWLSPTVLSGATLRRSLETAVGRQPPPLIFIGFSAGGVTASSLARYWHTYRSPVLALFLLDGWGVPLSGPYPAYRLSHDPLTHHTSAILGAGRQNFYADPAVPHRRLWQQPSLVEGWQTAGTQTRLQRTTAGACLAAWLADIWEHHSSPGAGSGRAGAG